MRRVFAWAPLGSGDAIVEAANDCDAAEVVNFEGMRDGEPVDVVLASLPNESIEQYTRRLCSVDGLRITFSPSGLLELRPGDTHKPEEVVDVSRRSPMEVVLSSRQSVGGWTGYLTNAFVAGCVVWAGFFTNSVFLLIGAMLIAPLAGPAMNGAVAVARGEGRHVGQAVLRYLAALVLGALAAAALTVAFGMSSATALMVDVGSLSRAAIVLPVAAGVVGAATLAQAERANLVSGAATGILVAAALAPPMGLVGMGAVLGEWRLVGSSLFQLGLQYSTITFVGAVTFRVIGVTRDTLPRSTGTTRSTFVLMGAMGAITVALLAAQYLTSGVDLQRSGTATDVESRARMLLEQRQGVVPVEVRADYTGTELPDGSQALVVEAGVLLSGDPVSSGEASASEVELEQLLAKDLARRVPDGAAPLVDVTALHRPGEP